jgi:two-component system, NtrC family, response regulator AtoC
VRLPFRCDDPSAFGERISDHILERRTGELSPHLQSLAKARPQKCRKINWQFWSKVLSPRQVAAVLDALPTAICQRRLFEPLMTDSTGISVLLIEDQPTLRQVIADGLEADGFSVVQAVDAADGRERLRRFAYDALVVDLRLPDANGLDVLEEALTLFPTMRAVVMTGLGSVSEAVTAIKLGAVDFLIKPFGLSRLSGVLRAALEQEQLQQNNAGTQLQNGLKFNNIVGCSAPMQAVFSTLELVAPMHSTVLIEGETGTGKELIARTIHHNSTRHDQHFVAFNAAAIPDGLAEAELFGHVKGAFTGAVQARAGRFELAHKGTLFIDEVSAMSLSLQAKLLRALQDRQIERLGESRSVTFDIRIIAATNVDLRQMVKEGTFREDLYYRLNVVPVRLPPLRARGEDVALLAQYFVRQSCEANGMPLRTLGQECVRILMNHPWPGNIRQLANAMEHAVAMSGSASHITPGMLPADIRQPTEARLTTSISIPEEGLNFVSVVSQLERELILRSLERTGGNKQKAARLLQLSRTTLIDKLQRLGTGEGAAA